MLLVAQCRDILELGKMGAVKKVGKRQKLVSAHSSQLLVEVDAVASPRIMLGEKYMHVSLNNNKAGFPELGTARVKPDDDVVHFFVGSLEHNDSESLSSSVGSCSPSNSLYRSSDHLKTSPTRDMDIRYDDAEAPSWVRKRTFSTYTRGSGN